MDMKKIFPALATLVWIALAAYETVHDLGGKQWGSLAPWTNFVGAFYVPFWILAAYALWTNLRYRTPILIAGIVTAFIHGLVIYVVGDSESFIYLGGALLLGGLCWAGHVLERHPTRLLDRSRLEPEMREV